MPPLCFPHAELCPNPYKSTGLQTAKYLFQDVNEWQECAELVGIGLQYNDC